jgi:hypothetical protein
LRGNGKGHFLRMEPRVQGSRVGGPVDKSPFRMPSFVLRGYEGGGRSMSAILTDLLLFSCLAAFVTGIIIAAASLLS